MKLWPCSKLLSILYISSNAINTFVNLDTWKHIKQGQFYVSRHVTYKFTDVILKFHLCKFCNNRRCWSLNYVVCLQNVVGAK